METQYEYRVSALELHCCLGICCENGLSYLVLKIFIFVQNVYVLKFLYSIRNAAREKMKCVLVVLSKFRRD